MDEYGYVIDVELAKAILIEFFSTGEYQYNKYDADYQEFYAKINSDLVDIGDGYSFIDPENGHSYFGGPEGASGYRKCLSGQKMRRGVIVQTDIYLILIMRIKSFMKQMGN